MPDASGPVPADVLDACWPDSAQRSRVLATLVADGLVTRHTAGLIGLHGDPPSRAPGLPMQRSGDRERDLRLCATGEMTVTFIMSRAGGVTPQLERGVRALDSSTNSVQLADSATGTHADDVDAVRERAGFDTRAGSRGFRLTSGPISQRLDMMMRRRFVRKIFSTFFRFDALVLTTIGRKTGAERTNPVCWFPGKGGSWLIVAAAGGTARNPAWYYNIAGHPDRIRIEVDGRTIAVTATQLHGAERAEAWLRIIDAAPRFARFQQKTDRELPVIRLTPLSGARTPAS